MKQKTIIKLLASSNCFKDYGNDIWPKETIKQKLEKNVLTAIS